ncbi:hypothetical protein [Microbacterium sp. CH-015]
MATPCVYETLRGGGASAAVAALVNSTRNTKKLRRKRTELESGFPGVSL